MTEIIMHSETQLLDWGETRAGGPWIKLRLPDPELLEQFRGMDTATMKKTGHILHCTLAEGDIVAAEDEPEPKADHGQFWSALFKCGFFRNVEVLRAIGPESKFEGWLRCQPAVIGPDDYCEKTGEIRNQVAHVRRTAEGAGTAEKPPYFAIPLSAQTHREQHEMGEVSFVRSWPGKTRFTEEQAKEWFEIKADRYRTEWASNELARMFKPDYQSRSEVPADDVVAWAEKHDLIRFIPHGWRGRG